jgi:hypothetical protein
MTEKPLPPNNEVFDVDEKDIDSVITQYKKGHG